MSMISGRKPFRRSVNLWLSQLRLSWLKIATKKPTFTMASEGCQPHHLLWHFYTGVWCIMVDKPASFPFDPYKHFHHICRMILYCSLVLTRRTNNTLKKYPSLQIWSVFCFLSYLSTNFYQVKITGIDSKSSLLFLFFMLYLCGHWSCDMTNVFSLMKLTQ